MTNDLVQTESKELTKLEEFHPTPHMLVWLDMAIQTMSDSPTEIEDACKAANTPITRQAFYEWIKKPEFIEWYNNEWDRRLKAYGPRLDAIGFKNAKRDYNYWKSMQQRVGKSLDEKGNVNVQVNVIPILGGATKE